MKELTFEEAFAVEEKEPVIGKELADFWVEVIEEYYNYGE